MLKVPLAGKSKFSVEPFPKRDEMEVLRRMSTLQGERSKTLAEAVARNMTSRHFGGLLSSFWLPSSGEAKAVVEDSVKAVIRYAKSILSFLIVEIV